MGLEREWKTLSRSAKSVLDRKAAIVYFEYCLVRYSR